MTPTSITALLLLALSPTAAASLKSTRQESWRPPKETVNIDYQLGWSPRPTDGPQALLGRGAILPRLDGYTLGPNTCGYEAANGDALTCVKLGRTCVFTDGYVGCCDPATCSGPQTRCIDYSASRAGLCTGQSHVLCCNTSSEGACFTYYISTTASDDTYETFKALDCSAESGTGILLDYDPLWSRIHSSTSSTKSTSTTSSTSAAAVETGSNNGGGGSSTPAGPIAGGVVGGVAALALVAIAVFLLLRRRGDNLTNPRSGAAQPNPQQPPMGQQGPYTQGVYAGYPIQGPNGQEQYDPRVSNFNQPLNYPNASQYYQQYPQPGPGDGLSERQILQHTGHLAGSPTYNRSFGGYQASSITTATEQQHVESTPSPRGNNDVPSEIISPGPINELEIVAPVGMEANRAELGGTKSPI